MRKRDILPLGTPEHARPRHSGTGSPNRVNTTAMLVVLVVLLLVGFFLYDQRTGTLPTPSIVLDGEKNYAILLDMGSSGTRVSVFQWDHANPITESAKKSIGCYVGNEGEFRNLKIIDGFSEKRKTVTGKKLNEVKPGVSKYLRGKTVDPSTVGPLHLSKLIDFGVSLVPETSRSRVSLFAFATAGLRSAAEERNERIFDDDDGDFNTIFEIDDDDHNLGDVNELLHEIRTYFRSLGRFIFSDDHVRILTGEEESMFGWMTFQVMLKAGASTMGKYEKKHQIFPDRSPLSLNDDPWEVYPIGSIDMGGSSTQYSFETIAKDATLQINVFGPDPINLFSESFSHFGMYDARERYDEVVFEHFKHLKSNTLPSPCYPIGHHESRTYGFDRIIFQGSSNYTQCYEFVREMFNFDAECVYPPCAMNGIHLPKFKKPGTKVVVMDNANRVADFFGFDGYTKLSDIKRKTQVLCGLTLNVAMSLYLTTPFGEEVWEMRVKRYCFEAVYTLVILNEAYHFPMDSTDLAFTDYFDNEKMSWTVGAIANELHHHCRHPSP